MENADITFTFDDVDDVSFEPAPELEIEKPEDTIVEPKASLDASGDEKDTKATNDTSEEEEGLTEALKAEYLSIYDSIMFEDKFEKTYPLGSKYSAVFSTRSADADINISRQLDGMNFSTMHAFQTMSAVLTMSHSLVGLNGKDLSTMPVADRYKFIRAKSSHLIEVLSNLMIKFDQEVRAALEYGEENF